MQTNTKSTPKSMKPSIFNGIKYSFQPKRNWAFKAANRTFRKNPKLNDSFRY